MTAAYYFNRKVRGEIDTSVRFIIIIYSFIFSMILYGTFAIEEKESISDKSGCQ